MNLKKVGIAVIILVIFVISVNLIMQNNQDFVEVNGSPDVLNSNLTLFYNNDLTNYVAIGESS